MCCQHKNHQSVKTVNLYVDTIYIGLKQKKFLEFFLYRQAFSISVWRVVGCFFFTSWNYYFYLNFGSNVIVVFNLIFFLPYILRWDGLFCFVHFVFWTKSFFSEKRASIIRMMTDSVWQGNQIILHFSFSFNITQKLFIIKKLVGLLYNEDDEYI